MSGNTPEALPSVIRRIEKKMETGGRILVTIDGPCASGKTTLAERLSAALGAFVLHTDDFAVPHAQKTRERLSRPGGNCDWERLVREAIAPWKQGQFPAYRRYDCHLDRLLSPEVLRAERILLLEGCYCNLPGIRPYADMRLFLTTPEAVRRKRLQARESPESLRRFDEMWIPLENRYFEAFGLPDEGCVRIGGGGASESAAP